MKHGPAGHHTAPRLERHRADRIAIGRQPVRVGDKEFSLRLELDHGAFERAAQPAEHFIAPFSRLPLDGVHAERTRNAQRAFDVPPHRQCVVIEEGVQHRCGWCVDGETVGELFHWLVVGGSWMIQTRCNLTKLDGPLERSWVTLTTTMTAPAATAPAATSASPIRAAATFTSSEGSVSAGATPHTSDKPRSTATSSVAA